VVHAIVARLRSRLAPALVVALGIFLLGNGLVTYTRATEPAPVALTVPTHVPLPTIGGLESLGPGTEGGLPTQRPDRVVTRVAVKRLGIDLPVVLQTLEPGLPWCDVAMYTPGLGQPGWGRATYIYAHARIGMFRPLLLQSRVENGAAMIGMIVEVWTSDDWLFLYRITEVRRHTLDMQDAVSTTTERLWLQTSEGPNGTIPKLQVVADFLSAQPASEADAHPQAKPRVCKI